MRARALHGQSERAISGKDVNAAVLLCKPRERNYEVGYHGFTGIVCSPNASFTVIVSGTAIVCGEDHPAPHELIK